MSDTPETDKLITDWIQGDSREIPDFVLLARRLERERDEARGALMKIEDLFIDCTDVYADREKMGTIAIAALEGAK
jgi:hypothetical protein